MTAAGARAAAPISWALTWGTARRVLAQLRHEPRTVTMIAVRTALMILPRYVLDNTLALNRFAPEFIGVFPFVIMFIVAAATTQRERARGTLERLMAMLLGKLDLLVGYAIAFGVVAYVQVGVVLAISLTWLGVQLPGSVAPLVVIAVLDALLGMSLGLFASAFGRTEFQALQFMPTFVLPQALLCGIVVARDQVTDVLHWLSDVLARRPTRVAALLPARLWHSRHRERLRATAGLDSGTGPIAERSRSPGPRRTGSR